MVSVFFCLFLLFLFFFFWVSFFLCMQQCTQHGVWVQPSPCAWQPLGLTNDGVDVSCGHVGVVGVVLLWARVLVVS